MRCLPVITLAQIKLPNIYRLELKAKAGLEEKHIIKTSLEKVRNNPLTGKSDALYHSKRFYTDISFARWRHSWLIWVICSLFIASPDDPCENAHRYDSTDES